MAVQRWVEMFAFNFAGRTSAYKGLAQGLSSSLSAFLSFMFEFLVSDDKAEQWAQYVDDIAIPANNATDYTRNILAVCKCIRRSGLKLTIEKCHFGVRQVEFLAWTISLEGISPQARKTQIFLEKLRLAKSKKALQRYLRFVKYYEKIILGLLKKLTYSTNCLKLRWQETLRQYWRNYLVQSMKRSVMLLN